MIATQFITMTSDATASSSKYLYIQPCLKLATIDLFVPTYEATFRASPLDQQAISNIAEPLSRPGGVHRFRITPFSLGAAVSAGMVWHEVCSFLRERCVNWKDARGEVQTPEVKGEAQTLTRAASNTVPNGLSARDAIPLEGDESDVLLLGDPTAPNHAIDPLEAMGDPQQLADADPTHPVSVFIKACMVPYGKTTLNFGADGRCYMQCHSKELLAQLASDPIIGSQCSVDANNGAIKVTAHRAEELEGANASGISTVPVPSKIYRAQLVDAIACKVVSERCLRLGYPCFQDYDYRHDTIVPAINCDLRVGTHPRPYQVAAVEASAKFGKCRSGVLVLPCGAGKTLVGVMMVAAVKRRTLIVCAGSVSVTQWKNQILDFASLGVPTALRNSTKEGGTQQAAVSNNNDLSSAVPVGASPKTHTGVDGSTYKPVRTGAQRIAVVTSKEKNAITEDTDIVITTYTMLGVAKKQLDRLAAQVRASQRAGGRPAQGENRVSEEIPLETIFAANNTMSPSTRTKLQLFNPFGLVILDEVHVVPAEYFKDALSSLKTKATIGLTATFVREDHRIESLHHLIGAKLYDIGWQELAKAGYLARVMCVEVNCPMTREFGLEYSNKKRMLDTARKARLEGTLRTLTSAKMEEGEGTRSHDTTPLLVMLAAANPNKMKTVLQLVAAHRNDKVLLFCDHILLLKVYANLLQCPVVSGETSHKDRLMIFSDFQAVGGKSCNIICISRVGDVSVNLPSANVVIQVSSHGGSRRQEAQRLGRVLRPKESVAMTGARQKALAAAFPPPSTLGTSMTKETDWLKGVLDRGDAADANAYFYSLVTEFSVEVPYATRRSEFLVDQGYPFYAVLAPPPSVPPPATFKTKLEASGYSAQSKARSNQGNRGMALTVTSAGGLKGAMAPSAVPDASMDDLWDQEWRLKFLARIISGWELRFYSVSNTEAIGNDFADAATVPIGTKRPREEEVEGIATDAFDRSHMGRHTVAASSDFSLDIKTENGLTVSSGTHALTSLSGMVLADDVVYHEL